MALSGKNARVRVNGTFLNGVKWTVNMRADELDATNFEDTGRGDYVAGVHDVEFSVEGYWQTGMHGAPLLVMPGAVVALRIFKDQVNTAADFIDIPSALLSTVSVDAEVRGLVKYSFSGKGKRVTLTAPAYTAAGPVSSAFSAQTTDFDA